MQRSFEEANAARDTAFEELRTTKRQVELSEASRQHHDAEARSQAVRAVSEMQKLAERRVTQAELDAKTDAVVGVIRRVPLLGRLAPKRKPTRLSPPIAPPPDSALDGMPDIVGKLDGVADDSNALLEAVVRREEAAAAATTAAAAATDEARAAAAAAARASSGREQRASATRPATTPRTTTCGTATASTTSSSVPPTKRRGKNRARTSKS